MVRKRVIYLHRGGYVSTRINTWPNRTLCEVLEDMRNCTKTLNFGHLLGLIEEAQMLGNRMEAGLSDQKDYKAMNEALHKLKKEYKPMRDKIDKLREEIKQLEKIKNPDGDKDDSNE